MSPIGPKKDIGCENTHQVLIVRAGERRDNLGAQSRAKADEGTEKEGRPDCPRSSMCARLPAAVCLLTLRLDIQYSGWTNVPTHCLCLALPSSRKRQESGAC